MPEPVRPATRTCCDVPLPERRGAAAWSRPTLPSGTSIPARLSRGPPGIGGRGDELEGHLDPLGVPGRGPGAAGSGGRPSSPGAGRRGPAGSRPKSGSAQVRPTPSQARTVALARRSSAVDAQRGAAGRGRGRPASGPRRGCPRRRSRRAWRPTSRRSRRGSRRRPGPGRARPPRRPRRCIRRSLAYSSRRYFCVTRSMWAASSASRSSIWRGSVQTWPVTSASSKSARCMNAPKFRPIPTGSTIVNRTWPGGRLVRSRNIAAWSRRSPPAGRRPGPRSAGWPGRGTAAGPGRRRAVGDPLHQAGVGRDPAGELGQVEPGLADPERPAGPRPGAAGRPRTGRPSAGRTRRPRGPPRRASAAARAIPSRHRVGHRGPGRLVPGADLVLEGPVLLVELLRRRPRTGRAARPWPSSWASTASRISWASLVWISTVFRA